MHQRGADHDHGVEEVAADAGRRPGVDVVRRSSSARAASNGEAKISCVVLNEDISVHSNGRITMQRPQDQRRCGETCADRARPRALVGLARLTGGDCRLSVERWLVIDASLRSSPPVRPVDDEHQSRRTRSVTTASTTPMALARPNCPLVKAVVNSCWAITQGRVAAGRRRGSAPHVDEGVEGEDAEIDVGRLHVVPDQRHGDADRRSGSGRRRRSGPPRTPRRGCP